MTPIKNMLFITLLLFGMALLLAQCGGGSGGGNDQGGGTSYCGDGTCDTADGEDAVTCAADCTLTCGLGQTNCGDVCVDLQNDLSNCGACGQACNPAHADGACNSGVCQISACVSSFQNCNGNIADGCEVDIQADVNNCGACGVVCSYANAQAGCFNAVCQLTACDAGFTDCNSNPADGCEVQGTVCP